MILRNVLLALLIVSLPGCAYFGNKPLETLRYSENVTPQNKNLFIFLRALGGGHGIFARHNMVEEVRLRDLPFDMLAPSASYAYYSERTIVTRLHEDVILSAIAEGYTNIWLVGVSMGGLGAMFYLRERPEYIDGVFLIYPFLGDEDIISEIKSSGGLRAWQPGQYEPEVDWQRMIWDWIQEKNIGATGTPVVLGYGDRDWYVDAHNLFSENIPDERVIRIEGSHNMATMRSLWIEFLERKLYRAQ